MTAVPVFVKKLPKQLCDGCVGSVLLAITLPVFVITAIFVYLESPGPVFHRQPCVGAAGYPFELLTFRITRTAGGGLTEQRPLYTRVGRLIRQLRIDELPQLINVLRGDISFVGPRPKRPA